MNSQLAEMSYRSDDKSAPKEYCMPEDAHYPGESDGHINPSALTEAPALVSGAGTSVYITTKQRANCYRVPPRRIALCGGGIRCIAHVGVIKSLESHGMLKSVKEMIGISAGAFFSLLLVLQYSISDIERLALYFDFTVLRNIDPESLLSFPETLGLDNGAEIDKLIHSVLRQKGVSPDITFEGLAKIKPMGFRCFATELQTSKVKEFSTLLTPHTKIVTAVRASMALPIVYTPVKDATTDALFVDGGLLHNLPLVFLSERELAETWGVLFTTQTPKAPHPIINIMDFFRFIYDGIFIMRGIPYIEKFRERLILVNIDELSALQLDKGIEDRSKIIKKAFQTTTKFLYTSQKPSRRFSAS